MRNWLVSMMSLFLFCGCITTPQIPHATRSELAPTGKLRAGYNLGNTLLSSRDSATGEMRGVAADLARELGKRLSVPVEVVTFDTAAPLAEAAANGAVDIAFLAIEPARAAVISFSPAFSEIEATYLVPKDSQLRNIADVDRDGVRVAVAAKTGFDLFLSRVLKRAQLVRASGTPGAFRVLIADRLDALAGLRPTLVDYVDKRPGSLLLDGRFTTVQHGIATPAARRAAAEYLSAFVAELNDSGFVARAIDRHGIRGLSAIGTAHGAP